MNKVESLAHVDPSSSFETHYDADCSCRLGRSIREAMDSIPDVRTAVVASTPLEALNDRLKCLISLNMSWGTSHESSVYLWHGDHKE